MGVPHFYSWLMNRYPLVKSTYDESILPIIDWFFMDLNSVIYQHALEDTFAFRDMIKGKRFEEIFAQILNYINEIIQLIQPQGLLFLAFDGVAPKAKMNQQRARRFKSGKRYMELEKALEQYGIIDKEEHFKNNSISPGTEFMHELSTHMQFFIQRKMVEDERWRRIKVVFSGVEVPGEGEHKILDYIRRKAQEPNFDPNTKLCVYSPDADLIMLGLTMHLPFVCILREQLQPRSRQTSACKRVHRKKEFDFVWINILREYFEIEFDSLKEKMQERFDVERIIDDFIFLCFFIGNDFLPRVFCLDIKVGNFDKLISIFKDVLAESDGYINEKGTICWRRAVKLFEKIAEFELHFIGDKLIEQEAQQRKLVRYQEELIKEEQLAEEENKGFIEEVEELQKSYEEFAEEDKKATAEQIKREKEALLQQLEKEGKDETPKRHTPLKTTSEEEQKILELGVDRTQDNILGKLSNVAQNLKSSTDPFLDQDIKFMSSLVQIYKSNTNNARGYYYEEKYGIKVSKNPQEVHAILKAYMEGLQFVLSYYYTGCPSWLWFYPFHYSPLISDLSNLMLHLNLSHDHLITFGESRPYDPFKQLLLIMPIGSINLLPEQLRGLILNEDSPLHKFYPLEFEVDPFGAVFESEYIAKIPFVDEKVLDEEYSKAMQTIKFSPEEAKRNRLGDNLIYEWDQTSDERKVDSTLPLYYNDFNVKIKVAHFQIDDMPFNAQLILDKLPNGSKQYHPSFPSLCFVENKQSFIQPFKKRDVAFDKCCFKTTEPKLSEDNQNYQSYLNQRFNCFYPFLVPCSVIGILTPEKLYTKFHQNDLPFEYYKEDHKRFYEDQILGLHDKCFQQYGVILEKQHPSLVVVSYESEMRRNSAGDLYCPGLLYDWIPIELLISSRFQGQYRGRILSYRNDLSIEFPRFSEVVINVGEAIGSTAKVTNAVKGNGDQIEVIVVKPMLQIHDVTKSLANKYDTQFNYRSVLGVAKEIGVDVAVIHQVLDCVLIKTETDEGEKSVYPDRFDLGLNLIQRKNHTIVPELIICHELEARSNSRTFPHFQLAVEAVQFLLEYYHQFKEVFAAIAKKINDRDPSILTAGYVFPNARDPNFELLKVYIWLIKHKNTGLILANKASKVLTRDGVKELEEILKKTNNIPQNMKQKTLVFNPNYLFAKAENNWIPPFYFKRPHWHKIGDRVVNLKINGRNFAPFGASGTVVGILGNKPENGVLEVKVEVLFDTPFIGGTNLGGRCKWGRGAVVDFDDIYNLGWDKYIRPRESGRGGSHQGWDGYLARGYVPLFQVSPEELEAERKERQEQDPNYQAFKNQQNPQNTQTQDQSAKHGSQYTVKSGEASSKPQPKIIENKKPPQQQTSAPGGDNGGIQPGVQETFNRLLQMQNNSSQQQQQQHHQHSQPQYQSQSKTQSKSYNQYQPQSQSQQQQEQQPKLNTTLPKTFGVAKQESTGGSNTKVVYVPKESKQEPSRQQQQQNQSSGQQTQGGGVGGSFDFNSFVNANLQQVVNQSRNAGQTNPQTSQSSLQQIEKKQQQQPKNTHQNQKKLSGQSQAFQIVQKLPQPQTKPPLHSVDVSQLEKTGGESQQAPNILNNIFSNPSALGVTLKDQGVSLGGQTQTQSQPQPQTQAQAQEQAPNLLNSLFSNPGALGATLKDQGVTLGGQAQVPTQTQPTNLIDNLFTNPSTLGITATLKDQGMNLGGQAQSFVTDLEKNPSENASQESSLQKQLLELGKNTALSQSSPLDKPTVDVAELEQGKDENKIGTDSSPQKNEDNSKNE